MIHRAVVINKKKKRKKQIGLSTPLVVLRNRSRPPRKCVMISVLFFSFSPSYRCPIDFERGRGERERETANVFTHEKYPQTIVIHLINTLSNGINRLVLFVSVLDAKLRPFVNSASSRRYKTDSFEVSSLVNRFSKQTFESVCSAYICLSNSPENIVQGSYRKQEAGRFIQGRYCRKLLVF